MADDNIDPRASSVLNYWLTPAYRTWAPTEVDPALMRLWFSGGPETDAKIQAEFGTDVEKIESGEYDGWLNHPYNALAGVVLMDQFTRNMYRGTERMWSLDEKARAWCDQIISKGYADQYHLALLPVLALPFMHSENVDDQQRCIDIIQPHVDALAAKGAQDSALYSNLASVVKYGQKHKDVIVQFGRFPHRNAILGRQDTPEEAAGLADGTIPRF